jgi:hypothetical protein
VSIDLGSGEWAPSVSIDLGSGEWAPSVSIDLGSAEWAPSVSIDPDLYIHWLIFFACFSWIPTTSLRYDQLLERIGGYNVKIVGKVSRLPVIQKVAVISLDPYSDLLLSATFCHFLPLSATFCHFLPLLDPNHHHISVGS